MQSIIIPTFNRANILPASIDASLNQTLECEIIVVDHGSTDETPKVMEPYLNKVKYIRREKDNGPHFCWLDGVVASSGDLIHFQFDDDIIEPTFMEVTTALITDKVGFAFSEATLWDSEMSTRIGQWPNFKGEHGVHSGGRIRRQIEKDLLSPGACVYRRDIVLDGLYQGGLPFSKSHYHGVGPDRFFPLLALLRYPLFAYVSEPLAGFRSHDGSITVDALANPEKSRAITAAYDEVVKHYRDLKVIKALRKFGLLSS